MVRPTSSLLEFPADVIAAILTPTNVPVFAAIVGEASAIAALAKAIFAIFRMKISFVAPIGTSAFLSRMRCHFTRE